MHTQDYAPYAQRKPQDETGAEPLVAVLGYGSVRSPARIDDPDFTRQEAAVERFCARRGWPVVALLRDIEPRKTRTWSRPSLLHAIRWLGRGDASCLVTTELSRLCPSVAQLGYVVDALDQVGARLVALDPGLDTGTPAGRAIARALVSVSSWERARKAEMTSVARSKGTPMPRTIAPDVRRRIVRMRRVGMTLQAIADELNRDGVPTARGGVTWRPSSVQAALGYRRPGPLAVATVAAQSRRASPPGSTSHPVGEAGGR